MRLLFPIFFLASIHFAQILSAQVSVADSAIRIFTPSFCYGGSFGAGDFGKRFGFASQIGIEMGVKFRSNIYVSAGGHWLFGDVARENQILSGLAFIDAYRDANGTLLAEHKWLDEAGEAFNIKYALRGFTIPLRVGKIFPALRIGKSNPNCGVFVEAGAQFLQHKIRIDPGRTSIPYLNKEYLKGYDRLTNGFGYLVAAGYKHFGNGKFTNFSVSLELSQNFTQNRRKFNYDEGRKDDRTRNDILQTFRVAWIFPLYKTAPDKAYYY